MSVALILCVHVAGRVGAYCCPIQADSYIYSSFGYRVAHGDVLYRDMSDIKPPGLSMLYALAYLFLPASRSSVVPVESLFLLGGYYAIFRLSADLYGRSIAWLVSIAAAITINYFTLMGHVIEGFGLAENFMVLPAAAAVLCYRRGIQGGRTRALVAAGLFLGLDTTIKQTALPVVAAVGLHWSWLALVRRRSARTWLRGCGWLLGGGCLAWSPLVLMMIVQGTWDVALPLLTRDAGAMIARSTAWPTQWREVWLLQVPLAWAAWGAAAWIEGRLRDHRAADQDRSPVDSSRPFRGGLGTTPGGVVSRRGLRRRVDAGAGRPSVTPGDVSLLTFWCVAELALLGVLPLRSSHYYVVTCVPLVVLGGAGLAVFAGSVNGLSPRVRLAAWSMAVIGSAVGLRGAVDTIVPVAVARYRAYDWQADQHYFDEAIHWGHIHFGRGKPWVESR